MNLRNKIDITQRGKIRGFQRGRNWLFKTKVQASVNYITLTKKYNFCFVDFHKIAR